MDYISKTTHDGRNVRVKDYKKRARRNRRRRKTLFFSFVALCLFVFFRYTPLLNIREIACVGNDRLSAEEIISASNLSFNFNILRASASKAKKGVAQLPYVSSVRIKRKLPGKLEIHVLENKIQGYLPLNEGYIYIDKTGKMLEFQAAPPQAPVPVVQNTGVIAFEGGKALIADDPEKEKALAGIFGALEENAVTGRITIIDLARPDKLAVFYQNELEIALGDTKDLAYKVNFALRFINEQLGENPRGRLDVSNPRSKAFYSENK